MFLFDQSYLYFYYIVMSNPTISFKKTQSPFQNKINHPPPQIIRQNVPINSQNYPIRQISRSPISTQNKNLERTLQTNNQNVRVKPMIPQENKKIDINLNIHVNNDEMITVNANSQNQSQQPMRISSPNNVQRPIQPLQQPIHQPIQPFRQGFQPPVVMNKPIHNPVYRGPIRQPNPQMIDPYYYQRANPHHYKQQSQMNSQKLSRISSSSSSSSPRRSKIQSSISIPIVKEERVYCVICQEQYSEQEREEHIKKHERTVSFERKHHNVSQMIKKYDFVEEPVERPIVQPEEYNITYEHPYEKDFQNSNYILTDQKPEYVVENHSSSRSSIKNSRQSHRNSPKSDHYQPKLQKIQEDQREYVYEPEKIRLSEEFEQSSYDDYSKHRMTRKQKSGAQIYPSQAYQQRQSHRRIQVPEEEENTRQRFILEENEEQGIGGLDNSEYKRSSQRKRIYEADKYSAEKKESITDSNFTYKPHESVQRVSNFEERHSQVYQPVSQPQNFQKTQSYYRPNSYQSQSQSQSQSHQSKRFSQIKEEEAQQMENSSFNQTHNPQIRQSSTSDIRSSQPVIVEPEIPIHQIIQESSRSGSIRNSSQGYNYENSQSVQKKKRLPSNKSGW